MEHRFETGRVDECEGLAWPHGRLHRRCRVVTRRSEVGRCPRPKVGGSNMSLLGIPSSLVPYLRLVSFHLTSSSRQSMRGECRSSRLRHRPVSPVTFGADDLQGSTPPARPLLLRGIDEVWCWGSMLPSAHFGC